MCLQGEGWRESSYYPSMESDSHVAYKGAIFSMLNPTSKGPNLRLHWSGKICVCAPPWCCPGSPPHTDSTALPSALSATEQLVLSQKLWKPFIAAGSPQWPRELFLMSSEPQPVPQPLLGNSQGPVVLRRIMAGHGFLRAFL